MGEAIGLGVFNRFRRSLAYLGCIFALSVLGYLLQGWTWMDSIYMVVITMFGVGFEEVHPIVTPGARLFTMFVIVGGWSAVFYTIGEVFSFVTQGEIMKAIGELKKSRQVDGIARHAIICGYGRIGQVLAHELSAARHPFVVIDLDDGRLALAEASGYLFVKGSATEEETLQRAHVERALVLATVLPQDTLNVFITLTARNLNRELRIIARGEQPATEKKLRQAGADEVILPSSIGGLRIAHSITRPATMNFLGDRRGQLSDELKQLGVEIDELRFHRHSPLFGRTVLQIQNMSEGHFMVLALQRADGNVLRSGFLEEVLQAGDRIIIIGRTAHLPGALRDEVDREGLLQ